MTPFQCILLCGVGIRKDLCVNVVLTVGTTMFQGFGEHSTKVLIAFAPSTTKIKVVATQSEKFGANRRTYLVFPQYLPAGVDLEGKIRESGVLAGRRAERLKSYPPGGRAAR